MALRSKPGSKSALVSFHDPYKPGSKAYTERHRHTAFETMPGLIRVDAGEPVLPHGHTATHSKKDA